MCGNFNDCFVCLLIHRNNKLPYFTVTLNVLVDISKLFSNKQQALSQFNENTLVKGVSDNRI